MITPVNNLKNLDNQWKWGHSFIIASLSLKEILEIENVSADTVKGWRAAQSGG